MNCDKCKLLHQNPCESPITGRPIRPHSKDPNHRFYQLQSKCKNLGSKIPSAMPIFFTPISSMPPSCTSATTKVRMMTNPLWSSDRRPSESQPRTAKAKSSTPPPPQPRTAKAKSSTPPPPQPRMAKAKAPHAMITRSMNAAAAAAAAKPTAPPTGNGNRVVTRAMAAALAHKNRMSKRV